MARSRSSQASSSTADAIEATPPGKRAKRMPAAAKPVGSEEQTPTKLRLLNAATFEFAERGFAGARIDEIARRAQLNKQLIYHYYGGKKQLYAAVLTDMVRRLQAQGSGSLEMELDSGNILEFQLRLLHVARSPIGRQWVRLLMFEALEADGAIHLEEARRRVYEGGVQAIQMAQDRGEIDPALDAKMHAVARGCAGAVAAAANRQNGDRYGSADTRVRGQMGQDVARYLSAACSEQARLMRYSAADER
jgi:AcrR family transcriptional regulator